MEDTKISSLWTLALQSSLDTLKISTDQLGFTNYYDLHAIYEKEDDVKEFLLKNTLIQKLIEFHSPHREILFRFNKLDDYRNHIKKWLDSMERNDVSDVLKMILWLCFENQECTQLKYCSIYPFDKFALDFVKKSQSKLINCKVAAMELGSLSDDRRNYIVFRDLKRVLLMIPNVEDLRIQIWCPQNATYKKRLYGEVIAKMECLKSLKTSFLYATKEVDDFCYFVDQSPKILEVLELQFNFSYSTHEFIKLIKCLNQLPLLKVFNLYLKFGSPLLYGNLIRCAEYITPLSSVRTLKLWTDHPGGLAFINRCFIGLKNLSLIGNYVISFDGLRGFVLPNLKSIESFHLVNNRNDYKYPYRLSTIWFLFPNLKVFYTSHITHLEEKHEDFPPVLSLENLIVTRGHISPPSLLLKMPNLKEIVVCNVKEYEKRVKKLEPFLPSKCRISRHDPFEHLFRQTLPLLQPLDTL